MSNSSWTFTLCADDYAISPAVSAGIIELLEAGRISATGAMTNSKFWPELAPALAAFSGKAGLGVHLNLTLGAPLGAMPGLAPSAELPSLRTLIAASRAGRLPADEIRAEIDRQLDAFAAATGLVPDFVDGHQHVQALPAVRNGLLEILRERDWHHRVWVRDSSDRVPAILRRRIEVPKALAVAALSRGFGAAARSAGVHTNQGFSGFSAFNAGRDYGRDFARYLAAPGQRHLIMCHPGRVDDALRALDPVTDSRERELAFFASGEFQEVLQQHNAELTPGP